MPSLVPILLVLCGAATTMFVIWLLVRRGWRQLSVATAYREVSVRLGLLVDPRGVAVQGYLNGRRLWIGQVMTGHGPARAMKVWGVLDVRHPLGLGLLIRRRGISDRIFRRSRAPALPVGDDLLDRWFEVRADEPDHVRPLLDDANVRAALRQLASDWPKVVVTDRGIRVHLDQPESVANRLFSLVDAMRALAEALDAARERCPPPSRLADAPNHWRQAAKALDLDALPWLPGMIGRLNGRQAQVQVVRDPQGYRVEALLWFRPHPPTGLRLQPQLTPDGYWSVGQDIQVGDPAFDDAFVIKGYDPERIAQQLTPEVRQAVLLLASLGRLELDDERISVRGLTDPMLNPTPITTAMDTVAEGLGW